MIVVLHEWYISVLFAYNRQSLRYGLSSQYQDRIIFIPSTNRTTSDLVYTADASIHDLVNELLNVARLNTDSENCSDSNSLCLCIDCLNETPEYGEMIMQDEETDNEDGYTY